ncbi:MAG: helix-turn-helix transcriptional regulator [Clostridia bacterium]|nr:helix-turn-helix transcriptional regulator [Clostridia bacterium]
MMPFPMIDVRATGQNISHLMKQQQISIRTLQAYFGFDSPRAIYKWLRGENLPTVDNLYALSKLLCVPMQDILIEQANDGQDVPFIQPWRLFELIQRNLGGGSRFFAVFGQPAIHHQTPDRTE